MNNLIAIILLAVIGGFIFLQYQPNDAEDFVSTFVPSVYAQTDDFTYQDFDQSTFEELRGNEPFSIFVSSKTCGTCAKKHAEILNEKTEFDSGTILKLEYTDAPQELIEEFEVTKYDTFITFDSEGNSTTSLGEEVDTVKESI